MTDQQLVNIYNVYRDKAINDYNFSFEEFWSKVCFFLDPQNANATEWALVGKKALQSLLEERYDCQAPASVFNV